MTDFKLLPDEAVRGVSTAPALGGERVCCACRHDFCATCSLRIKFRCPISRRSSAGGSLRGRGRGKEERERERGGSAALCCWTEWGQTFQMEALEAPPAPTTTAPQPSESVGDSPPGEGRFAITSRPTSPSLSAISDQATRGSANRKTQLPPGAILPSAPDVHRDTQVSIGVALPPAAGNTLSMESEVAHELFPTCSLCTRLKRATGEEVRFQGEPFCPEVDRSVFTNIAKITQFLVWSLVQGLRTSGRRHSCASDFHVAHPSTTRCTWPFSVSRALPHAIAMTRLSRCNGKSLTALDLCVSPMVEAGNVCSFLLCRCRKKKKSPSFLFASLVLPKCYVLVDDVTRALAPRCRYTMAAFIGERTYITCITLPAKAYSPLQSRFAVGLAPSTSSSSFYKVWKSAGFDQHSCFHVSRTHFARHHTDPFHI